MTTLNKHQNVANAFARLCPPDSIVLFVGHDVDGSPIQINRSNDGLKLYKFSFSRLMGTARIQTFSEAA